MADESGRSDHLVDVLIRYIIAGRRQATEGDVDQIVERVATAPFNPDSLVVPFSQRHIVYAGEELGRIAASLSFHLVKRVFTERQWAEGTSIEQYLDDLRRATRLASSRIGLYERRGGQMVAFIAPTEMVVSVDRQGRRSLPLLVVVYLADRGVIITGYQASGFDTIALPGDVRWLR